MKKNMHEVIAHYNNSLNLNSFYHDFESMNHENTVSEFEYYSCIFNMYQLACVIRQQYDVSI